MNKSDQYTVDEFLAAFRDQPLNAPLALYAGAALADAGRLDEALAVWTLGDDANPALRTVHEHPDANAELRAHSKRADQAICDHFNTLFQRTLDACAADVRETALARVRRGVWIHYASGDIAYETPGQRPLIFYVPGLEATPIWSTDRLPWADEVKAAYPDIRAEYERALTERATVSPYVDDASTGTEWATLRNRLDWSAMYIYVNSQKGPEFDRFPKTAAALAAADLVEKNGAPIEMFFSRLTPGAHIPPHHGLTNTRLTVHLAIDAPENCRIRVGEETYAWRNGDVMAFDDSFEHEAWNESDRDRTVLIFETHHPDLTAAERTALAAVYEAFDAWVDGRRTLIGLDDA
ncbi:MAG: aspartyl/asparaginyl beta-hydroxylase domain-containing protein [Pseudomonadota bacterium]